MSNSRLFDNISSLDRDTRDRLRGRINEDSRLTDYQKSILRTLMLTDGDLRDACSVLTAIVDELELSNHFAQDISSH